MHGSLGWCEVQGAQREGTVARSSAGFAWECSKKRGPCTLVLDVGVPCARSNDGAIVRLILGHRASVLEVARFGLLLGVHGSC